MLQDQYPFYLAGKPQQPNTDLEVRDKFTQKTATRVAQAGATEVDRAIEAAHRSRAETAALMPYQRKAILTHCVDRFRERYDELAESLCIEAGKPIQHARGEVTRLIDTFQIAAEESIRIYGEVMPMEISPRAAGRFGMWRPKPIGPCAMITPFNFPLNLVAHKVAPAIACGCPFVLKPALNTPIGALIIGEILAETDLPADSWSIVTCPNEDAGALVEDDRIKLLSFTGSDRVGWELKARAGKKKIDLELGGNAPCIIDEDADLDDAIDRVLLGAFYQSGQSCISVQRLLVHETIYDKFRDGFVDKAKQLKAGNPTEDDTFIGPIIDDKSADKIQSWVDQAVEQGGKVLCGGKRDGVMIPATVLEDVPDDARASCEEIFGPVVVLYRFSDFDEALRRANASRFGLQAGVFTRDIHKAHRAWDELDVGGVLINDVPSWRVDHMPYGGNKDSGNTREGIRFTIDEMTELRLFVLRNPGA